MTSAAGHSLPAPKRSRGRTILFAGGAIVLALLAIEIVLRLFQQFTHQTNWLATAEWMSSHTTSSSEVSVGIVHPYLGVADEPREGRTGDFHIESLFPVNRLGLLGEAEPIQKRSPDKLILAITGGSVARQFLASGVERLKAVLKESPQVRGRDIEVIGLARDGYKQPQQVAGINYLLALGGEFDVILNLDGFNELTQTKLHVDRDVFFAYPYNWPHVLQRLPEPEDWSDYFRLLETRALRQRNARLLRDSGFRYSALRQVFWKLRDMQLAREQVTLAGTVTIDPEHWSLRVNGPRQAFASEEGMYDEFARVWMRGSWQLQDVAAGRGISYIHCLQPNTHVGAKPLTDEEARFGSAEFRRAIELGYPRLREQARRLIDEGVRFRDLSNLFDELAEELYVDDCHLNQRGYDLLAERFAAEVVAALEAGKDLTPSTQPMPQ